MNFRSKKFVFPSRSANEFQKVFQKELPLLSLQELTKYKNICELFRIISRIITIILIALGIWLSFYFQNWGIFSRFGSLIVVHAIFFSILENRLTNKIHRFIAVIILKEKQKAMEKVADPPEKMLIGLRYEQTKDNLQDALQQSFQMKFEGLELGIFFLGTLIWGWGDLLGIIIK